MSSCRALDHKAVTIVGTFLVEIEILARITWIAKQYALLARREPGLERLRDRHTRVDAMCDLLVWIRWLAIKERDLVRCLQLGGLIGSHDHLHGQRDLTFLPDRDRIFMINGKEAKGCRATSWHIFRKTRMSITVIRS